mmetsp:Transcript_17782/g.32129  ORF Transcript_17782/g.32129 Transcript_17782/m.32129 type:complete len:221 (-) Transcript_17782:7402-8064(-)
MSKPALGYWKIRGLAEPIRHLLTYAKVDFDDITYEQGDAPGYSREAWVSVKESLNLPFGNLPYFIDGDLMITESSAIIRHCARKWAPHLLGTTDEEQVNVDMLQGVISDLKNFVSHTVYDPEYEAKRTGLISGSIGSLERIAAWLGSHAFLAGANPTYIDFMFVELLSLLDFIDSGLPGRVSPVFDEYVARFRAFVNTEDFYNRTRFPFNNKQAKIGGSL